MYKLDLDLVTDETTDQTLLRYREVSVCKTKKKSEASLISVQMKLYLAQKLGADLACHSVSVSCSAKRGVVAVRGLPRSTGTRGIATEMFVSDAGHAKQLVKIRVIT